MAEYSGNSNKGRDGELMPVDNQAEPASYGNAVIRKQSGFGKFARSIIVEDVRSVGSYILSDVVLPAIKKAISDSAVNAIDMLLYGKTGVSKPAQNGPRISYGSYYSGTVNRYANQPETRTQFQINNDAFDISSIGFRTRGEAEEALESMGDLLDARQIVTVGDLYDLAKLETTNYMVNNYGWTSLKGADVKRTYDGYYILSIPQKIKEINLRRR